MIQNKPDWLRVRVPANGSFSEVEKLLSQLSLHTVCEEASCPNMCECFSRKTATFMILGRVCTRNCTFCTVTKGSTEPVDKEEPYNVAQAVKELGLKHVVITSVTRDDLGDGGAGQFAAVIEETRKASPEVAVEVLIPDFAGDLEALMKVMKAKPQIINHNVETVPRLYPEVRPMAIYERSLKLIERVKGYDSSLYTKSGIMVGLGETEEEVVEVFKDLRNSGCDLLTVGQYLAPSQKHHPLVEFVHPEVFERYKRIAQELGFKHVASAPLVRSSYMADKALCE